jgi:hypothetical protein
MNRRDARTSAAFFRAVTRCQDAAGFKGDFNGLRYLVFRHHLRGRPGNRTRNKVGTFA